MSFKLQQLCRSSYNSCVVQVTTAVIQVTIAVSFKCKSKSNYNSYLCRSSTAAVLFKCNINMKYSSCVVQVQHQFKCNSNMNYNSSVVQVQLLCRSSAIAIICHFLRPPRCLLTATFGPLCLDRYISTATFRQLSYVSTATFRPLRWTVWGRDFTSPLVFCKQPPLFWKKRKYNKTLF